MTHVVVKGVLCLSLGFVLHWLGLMQFSIIDKSVTVETAKKFVFLIF